MNKIMFDDPVAARKMNDDKSKKDYNTRSTEMDKKYFLPWCPLDEKKLLLKHRYISCSRSVPRRSKRFDRYNKINRSLNFDSNVHNSSSENSSFEEDKHLSRSAKIMKALNNTTSPSYYGRTKIKKSLNFNVTPSVKRFMPPKKSIRKSLSLNFGSPLSVSKKLSSFDNDSSDSMNNKLIFTSSESIDENQNETPSQHSTKEHEILHFSTPNTKLSKQSLNSPSFTPLLRSRLKETIDNIVYITATSSSQSLKCIKGRSKCLDNVITNTSRNLYLEFDDNDDDRPCTPENLIRIVPESMSAIKRSHKKERSSRRSGHCIPEPATNFINDTNTFELTRYKKPIDHLQNSDTIDRSSSRNSNSEYVPLYNSEDNISETGSLFDYTEELKNILQEPKTESDCMSNSNIVLPEFYEPKCCIKIEKEELENLLDAETLNQSEVVQKTIDIKTENYDVDVKTEVRSVTPVLTAEVLPGSQKSITPENRVNVLQQISYDSIKKSHRKNKGVNRKQFFSSKVLPCKLEAAEQDDGDCLENSEHDQSIDESKLIVDENNLDTLEMERACTPEKVNSSRLLLSQFSSVKRSHKKDKHTKILSGFLKRQEYFNKEIDFDRDTKDKAFDIDDGLGFKKSTEDLSDFDNTANSNDSSYLLNMSSDKSSPSKRKISLNTSSDRDANASYDSELQECDVPQEEFQIFTPLKRKRSLIAPAAKEYLHFYDLPSGNDEISEEAIANVSFSRCLTPVPSLQENYMKSGENHLATVKSDNVGSNDKTGRSTPRNMSTEELYNNLDSIKKSHKKNKRGNILRKGFDSIRNNLCEGKGQISSDNIKEEICEKLEISNDSIAVYDANKSATDESIDHDNFESLSSSSASDQNLSTTDPNTALQNVTPPNSFKAKNYLRVLQETSIKRSHKKVRDQKKHNFKIDTNELSDDGSIFGDSDELVCMDEQPARE